MSRPAILFYCQHLLGIGHISRSLAICQALLDRFDVVFLQGGPDIGRTISSPHFQHVFLPPILMREHDSSLYDPSGKHSLEALWEIRETALREVTDHPFAAVVVELFPFGRNKFKPEILSILSAARRSNPKVKIYCSNRDIMVQKADQSHREEKIVRLLRAEFDHLLVHSDPSMISMDQTFAATPQISDMIEYTGYVAETAPQYTADKRENRILVSLGGGAVGDELAMAAIRVANEFPDHPMHILTGPYTSDVARDEMIAASSGRDTVSIQGFSEDFRGELARSRLSISLAGYNTLMDILATQTPALVYPYMANLEQNMRAKALEDRGLLRVLYEDMLDPASLSSAIAERLAAPPVTSSVDLSGAETTGRIIARHLGL